MTKTILRKIEGIWTHETFPLPEGWADRFTDKTHWGRVICGKCGEFIHFMHIGDPSRTTNDCYDTWGKRIETNEHRAFYFPKYNVVCCHCLDCLEKKIDLSQLILFDPPYDDENDFTEKTR